MSHYNNYKRNLIATKSKNYFVLPWACVLIKNCETDGEFLTFQTVKFFKDQKKSLWLLMKLHLFRDNVSNTCI